MKTIILIILRMKISDQTIFTPLQRVWGKLSAPAVLYNEIRYPSWPVILMVLKCCIGEK